MTQLPRTKLYDFGEQYVHEIINSVMDIGRNTGITIKKIQSMGNIDRAYYQVEGLEEFGSKEHMEPAVKICPGISFFIYRDDFNSKSSYRYVWRVTIPWKWIEEEFLRKGGSTDALGPREDEDNFLNSKTLAKPHHKKERSIIIPFLLVLGFLGFFIFLNQKKISNFV